MKWIYESQASNMPHYNLDDLYNYHAPNERTAPLYTAVRAAESANQRLVDHLATSMAQDVLESVRPEQTSPTYYAQITDAARKTAALIPNPEDGAPPHLTDAAHVAVSLVRNALNEAVATRQDVHELMAIARDKAREARWLTNGAIAVGDAHKHRPVP